MSIIVLNSHRSRRLGSTSGLFSSTCYPKESEEQRARAHELRVQKVKEATARRRSRGRQLAAAHAQAVAAHNAALLRRAPQPLRPHGVEGSYIGDDNSTAVPDDAYSVGECCSTIVADDTFSLSVACVSEPGLADVQDCGSDTGSSDPCRGVTVIEEQCEEADGIPDEEGRRALAHSPKSVPTPRTASMGMRLLALMRCSSGAR